MIKGSSVCRVMCLAIGAVFLACFALSVQVFAAGQNYQIGSPNTVTADPPVLRPPSTPCKVQLFQNLAFQDFNPQAFAYTPPANCPGPWRKIVFEGDFSVTAGVQFDRTANVWLGGTNIYFGTTAEPSPTFSPSWHVETDLSDYAALFQLPQDGQVDIGNLVDSTYTGIIYGSADVEFYPLEQGGVQNPRPFDAVLPLSPTPGTVTLASPTDTLSSTFSLPMNIQRAFLDVYAQSQNADEFWYACVPNDVAVELQSCPGTAFRETMITIDGQPAGVAPIFPWIYTGGIDPFLWFPLPGVQTLNFTPYRVDLTPFAGLLSNGQQHTVSLSVYNANNYFSATGTLLLLLDQNASQVTGKVTYNGLTAPKPKVTENVNADSSGNITGTVAVTGGHNFSIIGYVQGSAGKVTTTVAQNIVFANSQNFTITSTQYVQNITQNTQIFSTTTINDKTGTRVSSVATRYPLTVNIGLGPAPDSSWAQTTTVHQEYHYQTTDTTNGQVSFTNQRNNAVGSTDTLVFDQFFNLDNNQWPTSFAHYFLNNSLGGCYDLTLNGWQNTLSGVTYACNTGSNF
ncbi:MAG TPA: peptide-N4-asparagine amidase [Terriglobales bacterium]|nr:peptide-N4-asparagine amidase [Terriglobales bacterium]